MDCRFLASIHLVCCLVQWISHPLAKVNDQSRKYNILLGPCAIDSLDMLHFH